MAFGYLQKKRPYRDEGIRLARAAAVREGKERVAREREEKKREREREEEGKLKEVESGAPEIPLNEVMEDAGIDPDYP